MSEPLRIAAAVEGATDIIAIEAIIDSVLADTEYEFQTLQPETSAAFPTRAGWAGVYKWCRQATEEGGGAVTGSSVLTHHDLLLVHVDADVARESYARANIHDAPRDDLPCEQPCPPAEGTTRALQGVMLGWLGEAQCPAEVVLCTPSKNIEAWLVAAIWPDNPQVLRSDWECRADPAAQLGQLPKRRRVRKRAADYLRLRAAITAGWPGVAANLSEAGRFHRQLSATAR